MLSFWSEASPEARRALAAAALGWLLDAFDVMLYALVLTSVAKDLGFSLGVGGQLASLTLAASAVGGLVFGVVADRLGRVRALTLSILLYSIFTFACGLAQNVWQLAIFRILLGLGMGGEWASGAVLVSETWPERHRGKALGLMQSCWAIGYGLAAIVSAMVLPRWGWRGVFFVGIVPALFTLWIRRQVKEPELWRQAASSSRPTFSFLKSSVGPGIVLCLTLMNAATMFAWWGLNLWVPSYLSLPPEQGGIGLTTTAMAAFVVAMQVGMWFGYVTFGFVSDALGRKPTYVGYLVVAARAGVGLRRDAGANASPDSRAVRRVFRHGVLQRFWRRGVRDLSDRRESDRARRDLQQRPSVERGRTARHRHAGSVAWIRAGVYGYFGRLLDCRDLLDRHPRDSRESNRQLAKLRLKPVMRHAAPATDEKP